jgi:hypothetical protein
MAALAAIDPQCLQCDQRVPHQPIMLCDRLQPFYLLAHKPAQLGELVETRLSKPSLAFGIFPPFLFE